MTKTTRTLNHLVEALNDGVEFHELAAKETNQPAYRDLFLNQARVKKAIAADLKAEVARLGDTPDADGTWLGGIREGYAKLKSKMVKDADAAWIASIEEQEDRVLEAFRDAAEADQPAPVRTLATRYLADVKQMHDQMRDLKRAKAA